MDGSLLMFLIFILIVATAIGVLWYNKKYGKKINAGTVVILLFMAIAFAFFVFIKNVSLGEKERIINTISLQTKVVEIYNDTHKPYFKNMILDDGQVLPMPEAMNKILQAGDSIYKKRGENFYTIVNSKTNAHKNFEVKVHERLLGRAR